MTDWNIVSEKPLSDATAGNLPKIISEEPIPSTELTPEQTGRLVQKTRGTSPEKIGFLRGHERDIDYNTGAPFHVQTDVETADNEQEARSILAKHYGEENIGQDKVGRLWFKDPKTGKKTAVSAGFLSGVAASAPESIGASTGAVLGSPLGPAGMIGGAFLGGVAGKGITEAEKYFRGVSSKTPGEEIITLGKEGAVQAGLSAIPVIGKPIAKKTMEFVRSKGLGVNPISSTRAGNLVARGGVPPITSVAPEASGLGKKQDVAARVSYGGKFGDYEKNIALVESDMRKSMEAAGISPDEIDDFMRNVATKQEAVSLTDSGRSIVRRAQAHVEQLQTTVDGELQMARSALDTAQTHIRTFAGQRSPQLGQQVSTAIAAAREQFGEAMTRAYQGVHRLTGDARVVDLRPATEAAQAVVAEMSATPQSVPPIIRQLAQGERAVPVGAPPQRPITGAGGPRPPTMPDIRPREWQEFETIEAAHNLRNELRKTMRQKSLTLTPDQQYAMVSRVERALDDSFTELASGGGVHANRLTTEAGRELRRVDNLYREGIQRFRNATAQKLVNDARDGIFADPATVASTIFRPGQTAQTREILNMLPPNAVESAAQAHLSNILADVSTVDPFTGRNVINGGKLLAYLNDAKNQDIMNLIYTPEFRNNLRQLATEYAALNGDLELSAVQPSTIRNMLERHNNAQRASQAFSKEDPVGGLASNDPKVIDAALREISKPGAEATTEQAAATLGVNSPEWRNVQQSNLKLMFSDLFKKGESGARLINGTPIRNRMAAYTARQRELLFPNGMGDDILELSENINFLFPQSLVTGGTRMGSGLIASGIQAKSYIDPRGLIPRYYFGFWDYMLRRPWMIRWIAGQSRTTPTGEYRKAILAASGRMIFNGMEAGPPEEQPPTFSSPSKPSGAIPINYEKHSMLEQGTQRKRDLSNPMGKGGPPDEYELPEPQPQIGPVYSDEQPYPVRAGQQYAMEVPKDPFSQKRIGESPGGSMEGPGRPTAGGVSTLRQAASDIASKQNGISTVYIDDLVKHTGLPLKQVHDIILREAQAGRATLAGSASTKALDQVPSRKTSAIRMEGEQPFYTVRFKESPGGSMEGPGRPTAGGSPGEFAAIKQRYQRAEEARKANPDTYMPKSGQEAYDEGYIHATRGIGRRTGMHDQKNYDRGYFAGRDEEQPSAGSRRANSPKPYY